MLFLELGNSIRVGYVNAEWVTPNGRLLQIRVVFANMHCNVYATGDILYR